MLQLQYITTEPTKLGSEGTEKVFESAQSIITLDKLWMQLSQGCTLIYVIFNRNKFNLHNGKYKKFLSALK